MPVLMLLAFQLGKSVNRSQIKESMEHSRLEKKLLSRNQIHWVKEGRELIIDGKMFDVHSIKQLPGGTYEIYGLSDEKENQLNKEVERLLHKNKGLQSVLVKILSLHVATISIDTYTAISIPVPAPDFITGYCSKLWSMAGDVITPPPRAGALV